MRISHFPLAAIAAVALARVLPASSAHAASVEKPNFLFIAFDDMADHLGYFSEEPGNFLQVIYPDPKKRAEIVKRLSPNFDRLAARGTAFMRNYTASPICNASRTALLTGIRTHRNGLTDNNQFFRDIEGTRDLVTLPQYLKGQGYFTTGVGKIFHTSMGRHPDAEHSWSQWIFRHVGTPETLVPGYFPHPGLTHFASEGQPFGPVTGTTAECDDYINADFMARLLENGRAKVTDAKDKEVEVVLPDNQPFFVACGIFRPHYPWMAPKEYTDRFPVEEMTGINDAELQAVIDDLKDLPKTALSRTEFNREPVGSTAEFPRMVDIAKKEKIPGGAPAAWRYKIQGYLGAIAFADACLGRLLDGYDHSPKKDNTILVVWSDHGMHIGGKYHFGKATLWELATRCVLIVQDPLVKQPAGERCYHETNLIDLYPTIATMAGLPVPAGLDGRDISPLLGNPKRDWSDITWSTWHDHHTIRTPEWRFSRYANGDEELYDWTKDPFEQTNLAAKPTPAVKAKLKEFETMLDKFLTERPRVYRGEIQKKRAGPDDDKS